MHRMTQKDMREAVEAAFKQVLDDIDAGNMVVNMGLTIRHDTIDAVRGWNMMGKTYDLTVYLVSTSDQKFTGGVSPWLMLK